MQIQANNRSAARKVLTHLQQLRPKHPPFELYELDLIEVRNAADLERLLDALAHAVERLVDDPGSQDKAVVRVLPQLQSRTDQITRVLREIREDLHKLYEDSPGWFDALRDLRGEKGLAPPAADCALLCVAASQRVDSSKTRSDDRRPRAKNRLLPPLGRD